MNMRRSNVPQLQQQQQLHSKYSQQMNYRSSFYNNNNAVNNLNGNIIGNRQQFQQNYMSSTPGFDLNYGKTSPPLKGRSTQDVKSEKLQAAREAREKLDLYRSFELDEDNEFYPHQKLNNYNLDVVSTSSYKLPTSQVQLQVFRSPLSTPDRSNFQTNLSSNRMYATSGNDMYYSSPSPQRLNVSVIHNNSSTPLSNRTNFGRPQSGQLYYAPQNRSRY